MRRLSKKEVGKLRLQGRVKTPLKPVPTPAPEPKPEPKSDPVAVAIRQSAAVTERALGMIKEVMVELKKPAEKAAPEPKPKRWRFTVVDRDRMGDLKTVEAKEV